jgi:hypothetical protein
VKYIDSHSDETIDPDGIPTALPLVMSWMTIARRRSFHPGDAAVVQQPIADVARLGFQRIVAVCG